MRVTAEDLYTLRRAALLAERRALEAQMAQNRVRELVLELERKYGLLASDATLDVVSGEIREVSREPGADESSDTQGPA